MSNPFRSRLLEVSVVALLTGCGGGGESPVDDNSLGGIVDAAVAAEMKAQGMPGMTVAIARNGVILYTQGYRAKRGDRSPTTRPPSVPKVGRTAQALSRSREDTPSIEWPASQH